MQHLDTLPYHHSIFYFFKVGNGYGFSLGQTYFLLSFCEVFQLLDSLLQILWNVCDIQKDFWLSDHLTEKWLLFFYYYFFFFEYWRLNACGLSHTTGSGKLDYWFYLEDLIEEWCRCFVKAYGIISLPRVRIIKMSVWCLIQSSAHFWSAWTLAGSHNIENVMPWLLPVCVSVLVHALI